MKSGYDVLWSTKAADDLENIINYITKKWSQKEVRNFVQKLDKRILIISVNPKLFPSSRKKRTVRRSVLSKHNSIYYHLSKKTITILRVFDNRQKPI
jgi:plasmid stabilization system protein ParE